MHESKQNLHLHIVLLDIENWFDWWHLCRISYMFESFSLKDTWNRKLKADIISFLYHGKKKNVMTTSFYGTTYDIIILHSVPVDLSVDE
jgi:hypothetical protein